MRTSLRDTFLFYAAFTVATVLILFVPVPGVELGPRIGLAVLLFNVALPLVGRWRGHDDWTRMWALCLGVSVFMVVPDWFLSAQLKTLVFPDGFLPIGTVSGYMAGMWAIPFFMILSVAREVDGRKGPLLAYIAAGVTGAVIFVGSEATLWMLNIWYARNVTMIGHVAVYVVAPEILLSVALYYTDRVTAPYAVYYRVLCGPLVAIQYSGAIILSWFFLEGPALTGLF